MSEPSQPDGASLPADQRDSAGGPGERPPAPRSVKGWLRWLLPWCATAFIFAVLLWRIPPGEVWRAAVSTPPHLFLLAAALALISEVLLHSRTYQLGLTLLGGRVSLREVAWLRLGSLPPRYVLPFKIGELLRMEYLRRQHGVSLPRGGALAGVKALGEALTLVALAAAGAVASGQALAAIWVAGLALLAGGAVGALVLLRKGSGSRGVGARSGKAWSLLRLGLHSLREVVASPRFASTLAQLMLVDLVLGATQLVGYKILLAAVGVAVPWTELLYYAPVIILVASLPLTPMGLGTREAATVTLLAGHGPAGALMSAALLVFTTERVIPLLVGLLFTRSVLARLTGEGGQKAA